MRRKYNGALVPKKEIVEIFKSAQTIYEEKYGASNENAEIDITARWERDNPNKSKEEYEKFYESERDVAEELIHWHKRRGYFRANRPMTAASIAKDYGCKTFCEFGTGIGCDGVSIAYQGFTPIWGVDINKYCLEITEALYKKYGFSPIIKDSREMDFENMEPVDMLYSSDVLEHLIDVEGTLDKWINKFRVVIVYAPFGINDVQKQHTDYPAKSLHKFMDRKGYEKVVYKLGIPPFVYVRKDQ